MLKKQGDRIPTRLGVYVLVPFIQTTKEVGIVTFLDGSSEEKEVFHFGRKLVDLETTHIGKIQKNRYPWIIYVVRFH